MTKFLDVDSQLKLADILRLVEKGDEVVLTCDGRKIAEVKPAGEKLEEPRKGWTFGLSAGAVTYIADDFDAELPDSFWLGEE